MTQYAFIFESVIVDHTSGGVFDLETQSYDITWLAKIYDLEII